MNLKEVQKIYFIGIGGIGMSALARMMLREGKEVFGSDISKSKITKDLIEKGVSIDLGQDPNFIPDNIDLVVYTIAVNEYDPGLLESLKEKKVEMITYPQMLGVVSQGKYTIAVSGTHGKTTTTAMTSHIFSSSDKKATSIIGSLVNFKGERTNFIPGDSDLFIVEACEYKRSFLNLNPNILVITNIEEDHLDYYKDLEDIQNAFTELANKVPEDGFIICNPNDPKVVPVLSSVKAKVVDYTSVEDIELSIPGEYNVENARAAFKVGELCGIDKERILNTLKDFSGTWRRVEYIGKTKKGALVYDDYAHHPTEIKAALKGLKEKFPEKELVVVFQPHLFSRTKLLLDDFALSFKHADQVVFVPIYAAREPRDESISSEILARKVEEGGVNSVYKESLEAARDYVLEKVDERNVVVTMGAGDVYTIQEGLCE